MEAYHRVADTVGGVPNLRPKDNIVQTLVVVAAAALGALTGWVLVLARVLDWRPVMGAIAGGVAGLILGTLASGLVLMVLGWKRSLRK
ncbi:hypothetical protein PHYC_01586 [Phycisphaerales bacterium]|nr:hypothetical protein PHYC_01586 [Phycisphaerales bacterium]